MRTFVYFLALALGVAGCSSPVEPIPQDSLDARLVELRAKAATDDCTVQGRAEGKCIVETLPFEVGDLRIDNASPETILLVDELPTLSFAAIRYQHRIAGYYRWSADGTLDATPLQMSAPRTLREILTGLQTSAFVPAERYRALAPTLIDQYAPLDDTNTVHGIYTFEILVEHLPHHALVLMNAPTGGDALGGCDAVRSPDIRASLRARYELFADQIRGVIAKQNVHYINYSGGKDITTLKQGWVDGKCGADLPSDDDFRAYLDALSPLFQVLFATPGVVTTQAASYFPLSPADAPFDQAGGAYTRRTRVGAMAVRDSGLDERGVGPSYVFDAFRPELGGADVYVNTGVLDRRGTDLAPMPLIKSDGFGTTVFPAITGTSTSWAAPLALARLVSLRESRHAGVPFDDALIATLLDELAPRGCDSLPGQRCIFQDPLKHGQVEDLRLGYRPRVFTPLE